MSLPALIPGANAAFLPAVVAAAGARAQTRFWEFFAANIRNKNTRRAYAQATREFVAWCESAGVASIAGVQPLHVAAYIEQLGKERSAPTILRPTYTPISTAAGSPAIRRGRCFERSAEAPIN